jgi:dipeptidyl-peptidase-4
MRRSTLIALALLAFLPPVQGEETRRSLTLERITADPPLAGRELRRGRWRDARRFTWLAQSEAGPGGRITLQQFDAATGRTTKLFDPPTVPAGTDSGGAATKSLPLSSYEWNPAGTALLLAGEDDLWLVETSTGAVRRLTRGGGTEELPAFSPDGSRVAFARGNDLWLVEVETGKETRLTAGGEHVLSGRLDWVYEEELAGRRSGRSFEWSPDSRAIAYLRLDENRVPEFALADLLPASGKASLQRYPKAGDPNAIPSVHVVSVDGTEVAAVHPSPDDVYIAPELSWTPDSGAVAWLLLNRAQTRVEYRLLPRGGGASRTLLVEEDPAWVNAIEPPRFLGDGSFLFLSERSGFLHLWRGWTDGRAPTAVTAGSWMIDRAWEVDERGGTVLFSATEKDPRERHVYRARLNGSGLTRLTTGHGVHIPLFSPGGALFADTFSDVDTPPATAIVRSDGTALATVHAPDGEWRTTRLASTEFRSFPAPDGTLLYARLVRPPDFDPARKYPVVVSVYGGPHAQVVQDRWGATSLFDRLLAERGFLVWAVDNRGSWGRGHAFEAKLLGRTGAVELADQLAGVAELEKLPFVDGTRLGISGWSYGGYLALYAATHTGETFRCAVAGAPVTDWKDYDSIYTERYLKLPAENPAGYRDSSPLQTVGNLGSRLLLLHGTADDNVHLQQTVALVDALTRARKDYSLVLLPGQKHGPRDPASRLYVNQRILEFFEKNL